MTADDFFLLFVAFGIFVFLPALLLWGAVRLTDRRQDGTSDPDIRRDGNFTDEPGNKDSKKAARSRKADDILHRLNGWAARHVVALNPDHRAALAPGRSLLLAPGSA